MHSHTVPLTALQDLKEEKLKKNKELCGSDILKKISILDAIYWVAKSWEEVEKSTIVKCFRKSGFDERISSGNGKILI
jgi:hypothetical protein